ncbi:hypothetical protein E3P99_01256 [Wallemia hederae]|uniref:tRNA (guanine(37)-N1)-methyltransferase n=1 Tax=Wallemia hederae TaxID=1540922 RepID=A0A4T0FRF7_9BASI|nr:hypothetical protein E3P99_01256 [Wallemia hederae]
MGIRYQSTLPSLTNLNASWNGLSTEEKQSVYTDIVERQKEDWKELSVDEKRAAYFIAFGAHGPRKAIIEEGGNTKVFVGVVASLAATAAIFFGVRSFATEPPKTMSKEWQEASTEYMKEQKSNPISVDDSSRLVILNTSNREELPTKLLDWISLTDSSLLTHTLCLSYDNYNADEVFKELLPHDLVKDGTPTGFTQTGHLAHFNLKPEYNAHKHLIGTVILDKNPHIKTVVNKLDTIDNQFRVFPMELLAGEQNYVVTTKESDSLFTFDFSKVYWNSRLSTEHDRLIKLFQPFQVVADVMAGVGPFAIPSGRKSARFLANDLNPDSYHWLQHNIKQNKVDAFVRPFNLDGREFIRTAHKIVKSNPFPEATPILTQKQQKEVKKSGISYPTHPAQDYIDHYVMNLPATAIEFLDAFKPTYTAIQEANLHSEQPLSVTRPMVHVHCFSKAADKKGASEEICERATKALGHPVTPEMEGYNLHHVRSVAPNKEMYCLSLRIPQFSLLSFAGLNRTFIVNKRNTSMKSFLATLNVYNAPAVPESEQLYDDELSLWRNVAFEFDETPGRAIEEDEQKSGSAKEAAEMEDVRYTKYAELYNRKYEKEKQLPKSPAQPATKKTAAATGLVQYQSRPLGTVFYKSKHDEQSKQHEHRLNQSLTQKLDTLPSVADADAEVSRGRKRFKYYRA